MCGRYGRDHTGAELAAIFDIVGEHYHVPNLQPQLEIFPTNEVPALTLSSTGRDLDLFRWWS